MKKLLFVLLILSGTFLTSEAQNVKDYNQESQLRAGFLGPSLLYEIHLRDATTVVATAGASLSAGYGGKQIGWLTDYSLYAGLSPRYYYNFRNRLEDGKSIKNYSGNFISLFTRAYLYNVLSSYEDHNQYLIGPTWGIQRNLGKSWYFNVQLGAGASISKDETFFTPLLGFTLGIQL